MARGNRFLMVLFFSEPVVISRSMAFSAVSLGYMRENENPQNSLLCPSLCSEVPS